MSKTSDNVSGEDKVDYYFIEIELQDMLNQFKINNYNIKYHILYMFKYIVTFS